jgi:hypothetical protein
VLSDRQDRDPVLHFAMSMGRRKRDRQATMWVPTTHLPTSASHPFYRRLNELLCEHGFDDVVEGQCADFYAETMGRPGLPPGIYFRLLLIGYLKALLGARHRLACGRFVGATGFPGHRPGRCAPTTQRFRARVG